jgi:hypothetical protein
MIISMQLRRALMAPVLVCSLGSLGLVACGSDSEGAADTTAAASVPAAAPVTIEVDADSGTPVAQTVPLGTPLTIHVVTATDQEFHLHGYDIEQEGTDVTFTFTADQAGEFELESHATETVVLNLTVEG